MAEVDRALVGFLVHREIDDPGEFEAVLLGQAQFAANLVARAARDGFEDFRLATQEEGGVALTQAQAYADRFGFLVAQRLGDGACGLGRAILGLAPEDIAHARQALFLGKGVHAVGKLAAAPGGRRDSAHLVAFGFQKLGENRKARAAEMVRHIGHLDRVAQIGLVRAIPFQAVAIGDLGPVGIHLLARREFFENPLHDRLNGGEHIVLGDKGHLDVELVKVGRRAVGARVFVAEAGRDLEIAVKARDHDQLFELLGGLRQGIELAGVQARGHEEVARTLGAGGGDDRGLKLIEPLIPHPVSDGPHNV